MRKRSCKIRGSILMETVLVIPLYLVLLSGIFWVGDLALLRSKSTFFDRFAAWGSGNRHQESSSSELKTVLESRFLQADRVGDQKIDSIRTAPKPSGDAWAFLAGAVSEVSVEPPVWTQGWRQAGLVMMESGASEIKRRSFRSRETDSEWMHQTVMRTKNDFRENAAPFDLAERMEWLNKVYDAPWPEKWTGGSASSVSGGSPCLRYERFSTYVRWSE